MGLILIILFIYLICKFTDYILRTTEPYKYDPNKEGYKIYPPKKKSLWQDDEFIMRINRQNYK